MRVSNSTATDVAGIGRSAWRIILANCISHAGLGLTLPFILVYLNRSRGISLGHVGIVLATIGLAGLACTPLIGWLTDWWGARRSLVAAIFVSGVGTASFAFAANVASALAAAAIFGAGMGSLWSAMNSLLAEVTSKGHYVRVFSFNNAGANIGVGLGAIVGGFFLGGRSAGPYQIMFALNAVTLAVFALLVVLGRHFPAAHASPASSDPDPQAGDDQGHGRGWRRVLSDRGLVLVTALNALFVIAFSSQLTAAFPAWAVGPAHSSTGVVGIAFAVNSFLIAGLQPAVIRKIEHITRSSAAAAGAILFASCWVAVLLAPQFHGKLPTALALVGALILGAFGEILVAPSLAAIVNGIASDELRGRYNAFFNIAWQVGPIVGPAFTGLMLAGGLDGALLICLASMCLFAAILAHRLRRVIPASVNAAAS